jgi:hypothetical protein
MTWAEDRRAAKAADAEQARLNADAASTRRIRERNALAEQARLDAATRAEQDTAAAAARRAASAARRAAARTWVSEHIVDLLIYPLAVASAAMAIPSMAAFGIESYGNATGVVLPVLSELGMWAFALATTLSRHRHPDRPVWALQLGVWAFAAVALGLNVLHGYHRGLSAAVVMGVASIAGVIAHQLVTTSPRRSATERTEARIARQTAKKTMRIRRAAIRHAVAEIDPHGNATLVYTPGRYVLDKRNRLTAAIVPGFPVDPIEELAESLTGEVTAWLATQDRPTLDAPSAEGDRGPVATLDRGSDQQESTPTRRVVKEPARRSLDDLRAELRKRLRRAPESIDPTSAESIRKVLRCSPARARQLRDEYRAAE